MADPLATDGIVATALDLLELDDISSLADDSDEAAAAARHYRRALDACLEHADWSFARQVVRLAEIDLADTGLEPDAELGRVFALPGQALKIWRIDPPEVKWRRDGIYLRADQAGPLRARVTLRISDEARLPATFQLAVAYKLATLMSPRQSTSLSKRQQLQTEAAQAMDEALEVDARQGSEERYDGQYDFGDWVDEARL